MNRPENWKDYSDNILMAVLDAMVANMGRTGTYETLGINSRTLATCLDSRKMTPRMREALGEFGVFGPATENEQEIVFRSRVEEARLEELSQHVHELEEQNRQLQQQAEMDEYLLASYGMFLEELWRLVATLTEQVRETAGTRIRGRGRRDKESRPFIVGVDSHPIEGEFSLLPQLEEEEFYGAAAPDVEEWRELRVQAFTLEDRLERADAMEQMMNVERRLLEDFSLRPPPIFSPWDQLNPTGKLNRENLDAYYEDAHQRIWKEMGDARAERVQSGK